MTQAVYMASPYTHPDAAVREVRWKAACKAAARLAVRGYAVFSPIAQSHNIAQEIGSGNATDHDFWLRQDIPWLRRADKLIVLKLDGWRESRGVQYELRVAMAIDLPIEFIEP